jgi:Predicted phosphohydrolases
MKRKTFLQTTAAVIGGSLLPEAPWLAESRRSTIRFAHLSDIHLKPGLIPETGMAKAFQHAQGLKPGIDFILNGGDAIMDALEADKEKTQAQWDLWRTLLKKENSLPVYHTIGNHDIWGWFIKGTKPEGDRLYGKTWAVEMLEMTNRYYHFSRGAGILSCWTARNSTRPVVI